MINSRVRLKLSKILEGPKSIGFHARRMENVLFGDCVYNLEKETNK